MPCGSREPIGIDESHPQGRLPISVEARSIGDEVHDVDLRNKDVTHNVKSLVSFFRFRIVAESGEKRITQLSAFRADVRKSCALGLIAANCSCNETKMIIQDNQLIKLIKGLRLTAFIVSRLQNEDTDICVGQERFLMF